jgi:hypothetical protein
MPQDCLRGNRGIPVDLQPLLELWKVLAPHPLLAAWRQSVRLGEVQVQFGVEALNHLAAVLDDFRQLWRGPVLLQKLLAWAGVHKQVVAAAAALANVSQYSLVNKAQCQQGPPACWHTPRWASVEHVVGRAQQQADDFLSNACKSIELEDEEQQQQVEQAHQAKQTRQAEHLAHLMELCSLLMPPALTCGNLSFFTPMMRLGFRLCEGDVTAAAQYSSAWHEALTRVSDQGWKLALLTVQSIAAVQALQECGSLQETPCPAGMPLEQHVEARSAWLEHQKARDWRHEASEAWELVYPEVCQLVDHAQVRAAGAGGAAADACWV